MLRRSWRSLVAGAFWPNSSRRSGSSANTRNAVANSSESPGSKEQAIDPIGYELGGSSRPGCNDRQAGSHSFEHDLAKGLRNGRGVYQGRPARRAPPRHHR